MQASSRCEPFCQHRRQAARYALMLTTDMHNTCILNISAGRKNELETLATSSVLAEAGHRAGQPLAFDSRTTDAGLHNKGMHRPRTAELLPHNTGSKRFPPNNFKHYCKTVRWSEGELSLHRQSDELEEHKRRLHQPACSLNYVGMSPTDAIA